MFRFIMILSFLLALTINSRESQAATASMRYRCMNLFDDDGLLESVDNLIEPTHIKRKLIGQAKYNKANRKFTMEYIKLLDELYQNRLAEILFDQNYEDLTKLGFQSPQDARRSKEDIIHRQIKILSLLNPSDLTPEFVMDFTRIAGRMYSAHVSKDEITVIHNHLNDIIKAHKD